MLLTAIAPTAGVLVSVSSTLLALLCSCVGCSPLLFFRSSALILPAVVHCSGATGCLALLERPMAVTATILLASGSAFAREVHQGTAPACLLSSFRSLSSSRPCAVLSSACNRFQASR